MKNPKTKIEWSYFRGTKKVDNHYHTLPIPGIDGKYTIFCEAHRTYVARNEADEEIYRSKSRYMARQAAEKDIQARKINQITNKNEI